MIETVRKNSNRTFSKILPRFLLPDLRIFPDVSDLTIIAGKESVKNYEFSTSFPLQKVVYIRGNRRLRSRIELQCLPT